jgi:hypothetical protein
MSIVIRFRDGNGEFHVGKWLHIPFLVGGKISVSIIAKACDRYLVHDLSQGIIPAMNLAPA